VSLPTRLKRASLVRLAVTLAALAFPLLATGVAQASIAGATPASTTVRPDVVSATMLSNSQTEVCFDKTLNGIISNPFGFNLVGYRAGNVSPSSVIPTSVDPNNTHCVLVTWPAGIGDQASYTAVEIRANTVLTNTALLPTEGNLADAVTLSNSPSQDGTRGITTAPNLIGILAPSSTNLITNTLTYVFDKPVSTVHANRFFDMDGAGLVATGTSSSVSTSGTMVTVQFPIFVTHVGNAVQGGVFIGAVNSADDRNSFVPNMSTVIPGAPNNGATLRPDLVSATLNSDFDEITYTFDKNVVVRPSFFSNFEAELANGNVVTATGAVLTAPNQVTASFNGKLSGLAEFGVIAWIEPGAVFAADNPSLTGLNVPGSAPIGDNVGASSAGFTTGPDVFGLTMSQSTGAVTVNVDDRLVAADRFRFVLLDNAGTPIAGAVPSAVNFNSSAGPGPSTITLQYPASKLTNATQVQFIQGAMNDPLNNAVCFPAFTRCTTPNIPADAQNITQVVSGVPTAAILKAFKHVGVAKHGKPAKHGKKAKKAAKKH
jgi:hypothetical protein